MPKKICTLLFCLFCFCFGKAQQNLFGKIPTEGKAYTNFIPANCDTLGMATGDLNKDGKDDIALAIFNKTEEDNGEAERLLLILFKTNTGYSLATKATNILMCRQCGGIFGDPYAGIEISKGILAIHHYGGSAWRWSEDLKFRYQNNNFYLIGKTAHSYWNVKMCDKLGDFAGTEIEETNFVTGDHYKKKITETCKLITDKKNKVKIKPLTKLVNYKTDN